MKMKHILYILMFLSGPVVLAQENPNFSLYKFNMNMINPAYAGAYGDQVNFNYRSSGIENGPVSQGGSVSFAMAGNFGLGVSVVNDEVFVQNQTAATVDASYYIDLSEKSQLYFGLKLGANFVSVDFSDIVITDPNDPLFGQSESITNPVVGFGALLKGENYFVHFSIPSFLRGNMYQLDGAASDVGVSGETPIAYYLGAGMNFSLSEEIEFLPSIYTRFESNQTSVDVIAGFDFYKLIEAGGLYRFEGMYSAYALLHLKTLMDIGYAYSANTGDFQNYNDGSHELVLKIKF